VNVGVEMRRQSPAQRRQPDFPPLDLIDVAPRHGIGAIVARDQIAQRCDVHGFDRGLLLLAPVGDQVDAHRALPGEHGSLLAQRRP